MPQHKDFKRLVRERMTATGERYTTALAALGPSPRTPSPPPSDRVARWVAMLGTVDKAFGAFDLLEALPPDELRPAALSGVSDPSWRVRRSCCRLLDDLALTDETQAALLACLEDEHPQVRRAALHSLTCEKCKPDGCSLDRRPLLERMANDPSQRVRKSIVTGLSWAYHDEWAEDLLHRFADDRSAELRALAAHGIARITKERATDQARKSLPEELRKKTDRHPGKWVAIVDGRIDAADRFTGAVRRALRGLGRADADVYWVAPPEPAPTPR